MFACAAGKKHLKYYLNADFQINTKSIMLRNNLESIDGIKEVRSYGLMIAIELEYNFLTKKLGPIPF